jgi:uncharacterized glyoxalase superfamily protein PhnB
VTPWVISGDTARLIDFVQAAFGAHELARVPGPDGRIGHAEVRPGPGPPQKIPGASWIGPGRAT